MFELKYDKSDPPSIFLISLLHTDLCEVKMSFDNSDAESNE